VIAVSVADVALPVRAPTNVVEVTEVRPARVVTVAPRAMFVEPTVSELLTRPLFGMLVSEAPEPEKSVAVRVPDDGMN
jgi:hypothetical protein